MSSSSAASVSSSQKDEEFEKVVSGERKEEEEEEDQVKDISISQVVLSEEEQKRLEELRSKKKQESPLHDLANRLVAKASELDDVTRAFRERTDFLILDPSIETRKGYKNAYTAFLKTEKEVTKLLDALVTESNRRTQECQAVHEDSDSLIVRAIAENGPFSCSYLIPFETPTERAKMKEFFREQLKAKNGNTAPHQLLSAVTESIGHTAQYASDMHFTDKLPKWFKAKYEYAFDEPGVGKKVAQNRRGVGPSS